METSSAQCHYHLSTRISSSSNNIYKANILINLGLVLVVYITLHKSCQFHNAQFAPLPSLTAWHDRGVVTDNISLSSCVNKWCQVWISQITVSHHSRVRMWWWVTVSSAGAGWRLSAGTGPGLLLVTVCLHTGVWSSHLSDTLQQTCKQRFTMSRI